MNQYQYTEVAIDYNAGFVGALAGMIKYSGGPVRTAVPTATPVPTQTPGPGVTLGDANSGLNPSNFNTDAADTNCDGSIDIVDALLIAQYYVGLISGFC